MVHKRLRRLRCAVMLSACSVVLAGCVANRYEASVSGFRNHTRQTVGALGEFYASRNSYELDLYLQEVAADPDLQVQTIDAQGKPTPLGKPTFSPASIKARLDALSLVGVYADRLSDLATSDAPTKFQSNATLLGQGLSSLDKTFQSLGGASDPTAHKFVQPVSDLIGLIGQTFLEHKREELITKAITDGAPLVDVVLAQIRDDLENIFALQVTAGTGEQFAALVLDYNDARSHLNYEQRMARLANIKNAYAATAASVSSAPAELVNSMMDTHKALVQFAGAHKKLRPKLAGALNSALDQWTGQIATVESQAKFYAH